MKFIFPFVLLLFVVSCGEPVKREDLLPDATGTHGEIILLMEKNLWKGKVGEAVMAHMNQQAPGPYLQPEPMFTISHRTPDQLDHLTQLNRNLLKVMLDPDSAYSETAILEKKNYFARNQLFIIVKDSDPDRLLAFCRSGFEVIIDRFNEFEQEQLVRAYEANSNSNIDERAQANFGISIALPEESELKVDSSNFMWVKRDRSKQLLSNESIRSNETYWIQQGILFWSVPYTDTAQLTVAGVLRARDTVLKYHVPGKLEGSYMATEYDPYYAPEGRVFTYDDAYAIEVKGLWKHAGDPAAFGGGPFVQYTIHHKGRGTIITVCGYIYAPRFGKREYIREIVAMLNTIELVD